MNVPDHSGGVTFRPERQRKKKKNSNKRWFSDSVEQVKTRMLQYVSNAAKDVYSHIKHLTDSVLIQQPQRGCQVSLFGTDGCYNMKRINQTS